MLTNEALIKVNKGKVYLFEMPTNPSAIITMTPENSIIPMFPESKEN